MTLIHLVVAAILGAGIAMDVILYRRQIQLQAKCNQIWAFIYRRALVEALKQGFLVANSPLKVRSDLRAAYDAIAPQLADVYQDCTKRGLLEPDIGLEIEKRYWEWVIENVCKPFGMDRGECLVIAVEVARDHLGHEPGLMEGC